MFPDACIPITNVKRFNSRQIKNAQKLRAEEKLDEIGDWRSPPKNILVQLAQERGLSVSKYFLLRMFSCELPEVATNKTMPPMQNLTENVTNLKIYYSSKCIDLA